MKQKGKMLLFHVFPCVLFLFLFSFSVIWNIPLFLTGNWIKQNIHENLRTKNSYGKSYALKARQSIVFISSVPISITFTFELVFPHIILVEIDNNIHNVYYIHCTEQHNVTHVTFASIYLHISIIETWKDKRRMFFSRFNLEPCFKF